MPQCAQRWVSVNLHSRSTIRHVCTIKVIVLFLFQNLYDSRFYVWLFFRGNYGEQFVSICFTSMPHCLSGHFQYTPEIWRRIEVPRGKTSGSEWLVTNHFPNKRKHPYSNGNNVDNTAVHCQGTRHQFNNLLIIST
jgi:hypothetical protein